MNGQKVKAEKIRKRWRALGGLSHKEVLIKHHAAKAISRYFSRLKS